MKDKEIIKRKNKVIIEKVKLWQQCKQERGLICKKQDCQTPLVPRESNSKVILECPECGSIQPYVPKSVLQSNLNVSPTLVRNKFRYHKPTIETIEKE